MSEVMNALVIMHNMIIKDEHTNSAIDSFPYEFEGHIADIDHNVSADWTDFIAMHMEIRDKDAHDQLQKWSRGAFVGA